MRVLVSGGTGLIGSRLVESLVRDGHEAAVLTRSPETRQGLPDGVETVGWDAETLGDWVTELPRADAVVHLAGESIFGVRWTEEKKERIRGSRVGSGRLLAEAFERCSPKPGVLVQASGIDFYGSRGDELVTEETPAGDSFLARTCVEWEASTEPVEAIGVRRAVIRTSLVLSSEGGALPLMKMPFQLFVGGPVGNGKQYVPWIHRTDEVRAIRFLLEDERGRGPFNLAAPNPVTNEELSAHLADVLGRPKLFRVPSFALKAALGEMSTLVLTGQRAVPKRLLELGFEFLHPEVRGALVDLLRS